MTKRKMLLAIPILLLIIAAITLILYIVVGQSVPKDDPKPQAISTDQQAETWLSFPKLTGTNLSLKELRVPDDLSGDIKLIVVSYEVDQQADVDSWLPALEELNTEFNNLNGYYIPLLPKSAADSAVFIIGGMSLAAKNDIDRGRTIVVFTDVEAFNQIVAIPDNSAIQLMLINRESQIIWHASGPFSEENLQALRTALNSLAS